jgi:hypothetical protein
MVGELLESKYGVQLRPILQEYLGRVDRSSGRLLTRDISE